MEKGEMHKIKKEIKGWKRWNNYKERCKNQPVGNSRVRESESLLITV